MRKKLISMSIIYTSLTVRGQPCLGFMYVEAWLLFRNRERDYLRTDVFVRVQIMRKDFRDLSLRNRLSWKHVATV